ncbi:MAG TPA: CHAT domain-containing protein [Bryobacteraceae bacterium]|nr:CHAT domain-containing protein [Bryobacteraceae bacterium]
MQVILAYLDASDAAASLQASRTYVARLDKRPSTEYAEALDLLGASMSLADDPDAIDTLTRSLQMKIAVRATAASRARTHILLGGERELRRDTAGAIAEFERALTIAQEAGPGADRERQQAYAGIGRILTSLSQHDKAEAALKQALNLATTDGDRNDVLRAFSTRAYLRNDLAAAEAYLAQIRSPADAPAIEAARTRYVAAGLAMERSRYDEAAFGYQESLAIHRRQLGDSNRRLIPLLRNLGRCYRFQARFAESIKVIEEALRISDRANGAQSAVSAQLMGVLATAKAESGHFAEARSLYHRILAVLRAAPKPDPLAIATELFSLANLEQVLGDFHNSLGHAGEALAAREEFEGKESARTASIYSLLGRVNGMLGNLKQGRALGETAVAVARRTSGSAHPRTVYALSDLGETLFRLADYEAALASFSEARAGQTKLFGSGHVRTAQTIHNLGLTERALGRHAEAVRNFEEAIRIWSDSFGPDYPLLAEPLAGRAASLVAMGRRIEAIGPALNAARIRRVSLSSVTMTAAEREALVYARLDQDGLALAVDVASDPQLPAGSVEAIWSEVIRSRALVLDAMARRKRMASSGAATQALGEQVAEAKRNLAQAAFLGDPRVYRERVLELREKLDRAERELAAVTRLGPHGVGAGFTEVSQAVDSNSALVAYARGATKYVAFLWRPDWVAPAALALDSTARVDRLVTSWRNEIIREQNAAGRNARRNEAAYRVAGGALRRVAWDPVARRLAGAKSVYMALEGSLQFVNMDTLPVGEDRYLAETAPALQMVSAERDLVEGKRLLSGTRDLLAVGDPSFAALSKQPFDCVRAQRFPALPGSGTEARSVAQAWIRQGGKGVVLQGENASEANVKQAAQGKRVVHLATHGFFLGSSCRTPVETALEANPLLRSGLVLSPGSEDGFLTAEEVSGMNLEAAELVVLSGCDTALGLIDGGEGMLGLRRAFRTAGALWLVSSLWPVEDATTVEWMKSFYRARVTAGTPAGAVRVAVLEQLQRRRATAGSTHPFHWGAFVATGR